VSEGTASSPSSEDADVRQLHRRLEEVLGADHAATFMTCLRPGGGLEVGGEAFGGLHQRLSEVLGKRHADTVFSSLWVLLLQVDDDSAA
jgi:hypothetical protein